MSDTPTSRRSFSSANRWRIALDQVLRTVLVLAVVVMANYLGTKFFDRFYLSSQTRIALSTRSLAVLQTVTNQMTITLYYDTHDPNNFYPTLVELANEYHTANKNISVRTVDYVRDAAEAEKVKEQYKLPGAADTPNAPPAKDLVIFACGDRHDIVPGEAIIKYELKQTAPDDPNQKELQFRKKPVQFNGEIIFTSKLIELARAQPFIAYFLQGHGESSLGDTSDNGFAKFSLALAENDVLTSYLELLGDTDVPMNCNLLIIAAPTRPLSESELQKIDKYLAQGGRLLALFNYASLQKPTGLESILQRWGVNVVASYVKDPTSSANQDQVVVVRKFNQSQSSFVNPLTSLALEMVLPRPIAKINLANPPANAPEVNELAFSSDYSTLAGDPAIARHPVIRSSPRSNKNPWPAWPIPAATCAWSWPAIRCSSTTSSSRRAPTAIFSITPPTGCSTGRNSSPASARARSLNSAS